MWYDKKIEMYQKKSNTPKKKHGHKKRNFSNLVKVNTLPLFGSRGSFNKNQPVIPVENDVPLALHRLHRRFFVDQCWTQWGWWSRYNYGNFKEENEINHEIFGVSQFQTLPLYDYMLSISPLIKPIQTIVWVGWQVPDVPLCAIRNKPSIYYPLRPHIYVIHQPSCITVSLSLCLMGKPTITIPMFNA